MMTQHRTGPLVAGVWGTMGAMIRRGDATVGNPNRAQIYKFELFEFIILFKLAKQFSIEQFEPTVSQSTVSSPPSQMGRRMGGGQTPLISGSRFREPAKSARAKCSSNLWRPAPPPFCQSPFPVRGTHLFCALADHSRNEWLRHSRTDHQRNDQRNEH